MPALFMTGIVAIIASTAPVDRPAPARCNLPGPTLAETATATAQRLGDLPPAAHYLAVERRVDRCLAPVIVRTDIGSPGREARLLID